MEAYYNGLIGDTKVPKIFKLESNFSNLYIRKKYRQQYEELRQAAERKSGSNCKRSRRDDKGFN